MLVAHSQTLCVCNGVTSKTERILFHDVRQTLLLSFVYNIKICLFQDKPLNISTNLASMRVCVPVKQHW